MNTQEISKLLDKYYNGESSDEEELILRKYFSEKNIPQEFESEKEIFTLWNTTPGIPGPSPDFEMRIISAIDLAGRSESLHFVKRSLYTVVSSAAVILILLGSYFLFVQKSEPADTFSDPSIAYAETFKVLYSVSESLNNGIDALDPVRKLESTALKSVGTISRSTEMIESKLKSLEYFQKAIDIANSPLEKVITK